MKDHEIEIRKGERFEFGANWTRFLRLLDEERIQRAESSLKGMLGVDTLKDQRLLDVGSGSGLFSLAARRLGARVVSFDYDPKSVACTRELRSRYFPGDALWVVEEGSVLDALFVERLGLFDIVYSWGVLHHTGSMWAALASASARVKEGGLLFIALYNDQGATSRSWRAVKKAYNALPVFLRWTVLWPAFIRLWGPATIRDLLRGKPFSTWRRFRSDRGMSPWRDVVDWVGGYPFEVSKPEEVLAFCRGIGFELHRMTTCGGGLGCNEYVFVRSRR